MMRATAEPAPPPGGWARFYADLGLRVTPIRRPCRRCFQAPEEAHRCKFCRGGKKPLLVAWQDGAPYDPRWNVGVLCGGGLVVLDFDDPADALRVLGLDVEALADLTLVGKTGRGFHVYLRAKGFGRCRHVCGILVRGEGGHVVSPPSLHATGVRYAFLPGRALQKGTIAAAESILPPAFLAAFHAWPEATAGELLSRCSSTRAAAPRARARSPATEDEARVLLVRPDMRVVVDRIAWQAPTLRTHWQILLGQRPPLPRKQGGRSKSDWVISLCLAEIPLAPEQIAWVLFESPGSKAQERGAIYAIDTARLAYAEKWPSPEAAPFGAIERF